MPKSPWFEFLRLHGELKFSDKFFHSFIFKLKNWEPNSQAPDLASIMNSRLSTSLDKILNAFEDCQKGMRPKKFIKIWLPKISRKFFFNLKKPQIFIQIRVIGGNGKVKKQKVKVNVKKRRKKFKKSRQSFKKIVSIFYCQNCKETILIFSFKHTKIESLLR